MSAATQSSGGALSGAMPPNNAPNDNSNPNDAKRSTPINREQLPPFPASQHPERGDIDQSPDVAFLATHGVRVRDFAYGNTLPPVTTVPRFSVQTQPKLRMLKRTRDMLDGHADGEASDVEDPLIHRTWYIDSSGTGTSRKSRYRKKTQALARTLTGPADEVPPSQGLNTREAGFAGLPSQRAGPPPSQPLQGVQYPATPQRPHRQAKTASLSPLTIADNVSPSQRTSQQGESQETESWIDTPLVTPNGSLQWPAVQNTSAVPASELESVVPQLPPDEDITLSQLGFSPERSQQSRPHRASPPFAPTPSPAGTPSPPRRDPQLPPPVGFRACTPSPSKRHLPPASPTRQSPRSGGDPPSAPPSPRYHLRQRVPPRATTSGRGGTSTTTARARSRTRTAAQAVATRKTDNTAPPLRKKQKPSPPADQELSARATRYGRRKNGDVEGVLS